MFLRMLCENIIEFYGNYTSFLMLYQVTEAIEIYERKPFSIYGGKSIDVKKKWWYSNPN